MLVHIILVEEWVNVYYHNHDNVTVVAQMYVWVVSCLCRLFFYIVSNYQYSQCVIVMVLMVFGM